MVVSGNEQTGSTNSRDDRRNDARIGENLTSNLSHNMDSRNQQLDYNFGLLSIISSHHSEIHLDNSRFKEDPILQSFRLASSEKVLGLERTEYRYKLNRSSSDTDSSESSVELDDEDTSGTTMDDSTPTSLRNNIVNSIQNSDKSHSSLPPDLNKDLNKKRFQRTSCRSKHSNTQSDETNDPASSNNVEPYKISNSREDFISEVKSRVYSTKIRGKTMFQDCLVVTNRSIYVLRLDRDPITLFIEAAMQGDVKTSEKLAATFDLDAKCLLELAADIKLSEGDFAGAIALYRLSGCKHLKAVLKFAASGHVQELLRYLTVLEKTPNLDVSNSDRIHLSNLTLMAYFQQGN